MPIISPIGRRSLAGRLTIIAIYSTLILGGVTVVVPFLMTLTASVTNAYDLEKYRLVPYYLWNDDELYCKYLVDKYPFSYFTRAKSSHQLIDVSDARQLMRVPHPADVLPEIWAYHNLPRPNYELIRKDYYAFLADYPAEKLTTPYFIYLLEDEWRRWLRDRYVKMAYEQGLIREGQSPEAVAYDLMIRLYGEVVTAGFDTARFPEGEGFAPKIYWRNEQQARDYHEFLAQQQISYMQPQRGDLQYQWFLTREYGEIEELNSAWGTSYEDFVQIILPLYPPAHPRRLADWQEFRKNYVKLVWVSVRESYATGFRSFLRERLGSLEIASTRLEKSYTSWEQIPFTTRYEGNRGYRELWSEFVLERVPVSDRNISYFEKDYAKYLKAKYGTARALAAAYEMPVASIDDFRLPYAGLDYDDFYRNRGKWKRHFLTYNFVYVFKFIATKGRALWNTLVLVGLTILGGITINPIAAFALSRYHVPRIQLILLFLLIPMAFPPEVSMIPSFLLLRSFPLMIVLTAIGVVFALLLWLYVLRPLFRQSGVLTGLGVIASCALAIWLVPLLYRITGKPSEVPLLNTYVALIMPSLANGFAIFLLKGFFDGLPRELYEAAQLDGAGELLMFRMITFPLAKPIVTYTVMGMALGAYGGFMWAFVVVPDERMWTLMVWLYQFSVDNASDRMSLVMASLVMASIPTLLFFAFCQRVILRGIILPVMK